jgi:hypothetical protein
MPLDADNPGGPKHHVCADCGGDSSEVIPIGTREVKAKRPRSSYVPHVLRPGPSPLAVAAAARVVAAAIDAVVVDAAAAAVIAVADAPDIYYGCD